MACMRHRLVSSKGKALSLCVDEQTIIPYILTTSNNTELAFKTASRANLPGPDDLDIRQHQRPFGSARFNEATKMAGNFSRASLTLSSLHIQIPQCIQG